MSKKLYSLTDAHRAQLKPWADRWVAIAMSTKEVDANERSLCDAAARGLYAAAKLAEPKQVVFAKSPLTATIAAGVAAGVIYLRNNPDQQRKLFGRLVTERELMGSVAPACLFAVQCGLYRTEHLNPPPVGTFKIQARKQVGSHAATRVATSGATDAATDAATRDATRVATSGATYAATHDATYAATDAATSGATDAATDAATRAATRDATRAATDAATRDATSDATDAATNDATRAATDAATRDATSDATYAATSDATRDATYAATDAATRDATHDATDAATRAATYAATDAATRDADLILVSDDVARFLVQCVYRAWYMRNGGNQWAGWVSYLSFFRHVVKLDESHRVDYSKWGHYEALAEHGGPRLMHKDFCIISDRPAVLLVDERNRPHCATGPSHKWRDGWALYFWHGVRVPKRMIEAPESYTRDEILGIGNTEQRRALAERLGWPRYLEKLGGSIVSTWEDPETKLAYELFELSETGERILRKQSPALKDGSQPWYAEPVHRDLLTAQAARKWQAITPFTSDPRESARLCNSNPALSYTVEA
jgi:hypothetical protein